MVSLLSNSQTGSSGCHVGWSGPHIGNEGARSNVVPLFPDRAREPAHWSSQHARVVKDKEMWCSSTQDVVRLLLLGNSARCLAELAVSCTYKHQRYDDCDPGRVIFWQDKVKSVELRNEPRTGQPGSHSSCGHVGQTAQSGRPTYCQNMR